jgi:hypothetical protein
MMSGTSHETAPPHPRDVLARAARWLGIFGGVLLIVGLIVMISAFMSVQQEGRYGPVLRGCMALIGWVVPGLIYLLCAWAIPRRQRWAIGTANITTWLQLFFAGAMAILSILQIKLMWPWMITGLMWIPPLLLIPRIIEPCERAMDLIAQLPTLGAKTPRKSR